MHCTRWVMSCLPPLFIEERRTYICSPPLFMEDRRTYIFPSFRGTANEHCLILWSVRSLYHTGLLQDFLYPQSRNRKKLHDIAQKLTSSYSCRGLECKKSTEIEVKETEKGVAEKLTRPLPWYDLPPHYIKK